MAELLSEWALNGKLRYTRHNTGWPLESRKYTIKKYKYKIQLTTIGFYDTISMSFCFGFHIRRYKRKLVIFFIQAGIKNKTPIQIDGYKELIERLKSQTKHIC